jgi:hypothetical protein
MQQINKTRNFENKNQNTRTGKQRQREVKKQVDSVCESKG